MSDNQRWLEVKTGMLLHVPFFASLLLDYCTVKVGKFPEIMPGDKPTFATDGRRIWMDEDFLNSLTLPKAVFATCHEIGHVMFMHMARAKDYETTGLGGYPFSPRLYNIAADYVINAMLIDAKIGEFDQNWLYDKKYTGNMTVEEVYLDLLKRFPPPPSGGSGSQKGGGQQGQGQGQGQPGQGQPQGGPNGNDPAGGKGTLDQHVYSNDTGATEQEMKRAIATAAEAAKAMGKLPGSLQRFVTEVLEPKVKWSERLRFHVSRAITRDSRTWSRPHRRRLVTQKVYLPTSTGFGAGHVVFATDTSGSMGQKEYNAACAELEDILTTCQPERVTLLGCDADVHDHFELEPGESIIGNEPKLKGGGGTAFEPVFDWIKENCSEPPAVLIYFTDMYGSFPPEEPDYPVIWVTTTDVQHKWGEHIRVEL